MIDSKKVDNKFISMAYQLVYYHLFSFNQYYELHNLLFIATYDQRIIGILSIFKNLIKILIFIIG
jgi:hypothetical protein